MQALQQRLDVNTCWVTRRRNTTEPNRRFFDSGEITAPSSVHHPTESETERETETLRFINKAGVFRRKRKAWGFDLIFVNVRHFVTADGEIYSGLCTI